MKNPRVWLGFLISAVAVVSLVMTTDLPRLGAALASADPLLILATIATLPVTMYLKTHRWRYFFPEAGRVSMRGLLSGLYIGYMANTVIPLRVGELIRSFLVSQTERVSMSTVLATVLIEKVFDLGTMALFLFLLRFVMTLPEAAEIAAIWSGVGLLVAVVGLAVALTARGLALQIAREVERRVPPLKRLDLPGLLTAFLDGLAFVRDPRRLALVLFWSLVMWTGSGITVYLGLASLGIWAGSWVALFVLVVTNLGMAVPSAPGYVGVFHWAVVFALDPFGIDSGRALAAAILLHAVIFGTFVVGGLYYMIGGRRPESVGGGLTDLAARARSSAHEAQPH